MMLPVRLMMAIIAAGVLAQGQSKLAFEVASVKPTDGVGIREFRSGRVSIGGLNLQQLVFIAYGLSPARPFASVGPKWITDPYQRFAIEARGEPGTEGELKLMMQNLLEQRFNLKVRRETKEVPGYALVLARSDGRFGPNLVEVTGKPCSVPDAVPEPQENVPRCGMINRPFSEQEGLRLFAARMKHLADSLSQPIYDVGRPVVDRTGLTGEYDIKFAFALLAGTPSGGIGPTDRVNGPSLAAALRDQLGLKLDSVRISVETLVVEDAKMPTEN